MIVLFMVTYLLRNTGAPGVNQGAECGMEQLVARHTHNVKVTGSSPVPATK